MAIPVVPIKVKIALRPNGHADHPAWERLPMIAALVSADAARQDIDNAVNQFTFGNPRWCYDQTSGHDDDTPDSPVGMQWGMRLVTAQFAAEAVATFPSLVTILTAAEAEDFYDNRAMINVSDERRDERVLQALLTERQLTKDVRPLDAARLAALDSKIVKALDPDDPEPGVRRNPLRRWATAKGRMGVEFAL